MNTLKMKSWLTNFYLILRSSNMSFVRVIFDYIKIKKNISQKHSTIFINLESEEAETFEKYFVLKDNFIQHSLLRAINLNLHKESNKLSILDLGTGAGYFPFVCKYFGHDADSIDIKGNNFYDKSTNALNLVKYHQEILHNEKLVIDKKYDLICAYMICFNGHKSSNLWGIYEWSNFLNILINNNLQTNGKIFLSFNREENGEPFSDELEKFFCSFAKKMSSNEILIENNQHLVTSIKTYNNLST